jgi:hypothetical protein
MRSRIDAVSSQSLLPLMPPAFENIGGNRAFSK